MGKQRFIRRGVINMERPKRVKRVIKCEVCGQIKRLVRSAKVWVDAVSENPVTGQRTTGGYLARICELCRVKVGYVGKKKNKLTTEVVTDNTGEGGGGGII